MTTPDTFEIFLVTAPGLEDAVRAEAIELGFAKPTVMVGGVTIRGSWPEVWRANLMMRGPTKVLLRIGSFHAQHLSQLDKLARKFPWKTFLRHNVPVSIEVTCKKSKIYHADAAAQRFKDALQEGHEIVVTEDATLVIHARFENDECTISLDTSGGSLHKRGHKDAVGKAPLRETMAAMFLRQCGYKGTEPVVDPMCGSGTLLIEAAEIAAGLFPGRNRDFAFERLRSFNAESWAALKATPPRLRSQSLFFGADRDETAIRNATTNAKQAGVANSITFKQQVLNDFRPPEGPKGLVMINPPYGTRLGEKKQLFGLYGAIGKTLSENFSGWRIGLITPDHALAAATKLPFLPQGRSVVHGGLKVVLFHTAALP
jgi:putative N6-adenine-specific DNA methylase